MKNWIFYGICFVFILFTSYKITTLAFDYSDEQQEVMDFLKGQGILKGFTEREVEHFRDVKDVMVLGDLVFFLSLILTAVMVYMGFGRQLLHAGIFSLIVFVLMGIAGSFFFMTLFDYFHRPLFASGSWIFPADSKTIMLFPIGFFISIVQKILLSSLSISGAFIFTGLLVRDYMTGSSKILVPLWVIWGILTTVSIGTLALIHNTLILLLPSVFMIVLLIIGRYYETYYNN